MEGRFLMKNLILPTRDTLRKDASGCYVREKGLNSFIDSLEDRTIRFNTQRRPSLPLGMAKPGERITIKEILGGKEMRSRLASMGFRQGNLLEVINNNGQGRMIVGCGQTRLAFGRGIAQKIMVSLASPHQEMVCSFKDN